MAVDYYRLLGVGPSANADVVESAYRRLARKYHPDVNRAEDAGIIMRQINEAYAVLRDPVRRSAYDSERRSLFAAAWEEAAAQPRQEPRPAEPASPRAGGRDRRRRSATRAPRPPPSRSAHAAPAVGRGWAVRTIGRRSILAIGLGALVVAVGLAALAAALFVPANLGIVAETPAATVVVVSGEVAPSPTPIAAVRPTATTAPWPPFPLADYGVTDESQGSGEPAGVLAEMLSRASAAFQRGVLSGPRAPSPPSTPAVPR